MSGDRKREKRVDVRMEPDLHDEAQAWLAEQNKGRERKVSLSALIRALLRRTLHEDEALPPEGYLEYEVERPSRKRKR